MVFRKIIAVFCSIAISFSLLSAPVAAITGEEAALGLGVLQFAYQLYHDWKTDHPDTPDSEYPGFNPGGMFGGGAGRDDLSAAYDTYVQDLPAQTFDSSGDLRFRLNVNRFQGEGKVSIDASTCGSSFSVAFHSTDLSGWAQGLLEEFKAPLAGDYRLIACLESSDSHVCFLSGHSNTWQLLSSSSGIPSKASSDSVLWQGCGVFDVFSPLGAAVGDVLISDGTSFKVGGPQKTITTFSGYLELACTPVTLSADAYNTTTRPTSITGGNYGIVGDNNEITKVQDNSTIVNETNNTYYNPATGATVPIVDWSYDYSDRSYTVTTESGDTATITYGDENISIVENSTSSGDTVTNNYTIYYLVDGSGEAPTDCPHNWTETSTTPAACTVPGSKLLTCSLCSQTKTESIPALGHDWLVKQTVTTQYDETGQLTQQGYTIFECSVCHEQYKSEDGALPPGGGSGTDPGGDGETIWDKLAHLIGAIGNGVISVIEGVLGKLLDGLIALAEMLVEKLGTVVDAVLKVFDEIPRLFGGFLDFLAALFPYLPPELMTILTFGVIAVVFIGIIKAVVR